MADVDPGSLTIDVLSAMSDIVYVVDSDGRLVWWNDRLPEVTGHTDVELSEKSSFELLAEPDRKRAAELFERLVDDGRAPVPEFDVVTADGDVIPHEFNSTPISTEEFDGVVGVARDVSDRRAREESLRRQRDSLETLNRINGTVHEVIRALVAAATREEIESIVTEGLAASELYRAVWIAREESGLPAEPHASTGVTETFLEGVAEVSQLPQCGYPPAVALETGEIQVVQEIPDSDHPQLVKDVAARLDIRSNASVPIAHRGTTYGVLVVCSSRPDGFGDHERTALERLAETIALAIGAVQTEQLLLSESVTELTFRIDDDDAFLAVLSELADGPCRHRWTTPLADGRYRHYVSVSGVDPEAAERIADEREWIERCDHVGTDGNTEVYEVVTTDSVIRHLFDAGVSPTSVVAEDGTTTIVAETAADADITPVVKTAEELYDARLVAKRQVERPIRTADEFYDAVADRLNDRQTKALKHAYFGGYFSWPRDSTAEELAEGFGVSSPTFHYHLRRAQSALAEAYIEYLED